MGKPRAPLKRLRRFFAAAYSHNVLYHASALSFDALLAAIPLAFLFLSVLGFVVNVGGGAADEVLTALELLLPRAGQAEPIDRAEALIAAVVESRVQFSLFGIPLYLIFSSRLFASSRIALDSILGAEKRRRWHHDIAHDVLLVLVVAVLFTANALVRIPVFGAPRLDSLIGYAAATGFAVVLFFIVYSLAPTDRMPARVALLSAAVAAAAFELSKGLYTIYLENFVTLNQVFSHTNALAVLLFVVWVYVAALIFLMGGHVAAEVMADDRETGHTLA